MREFSIREILDITGGSLLCGDVDMHEKIRYIETDSRKVKPGALFVAIVGARSDAHDFLDSVFESGAVAALVSRPDLKHIPGKACILVGNTVFAAQKLAQVYRDELNIPFVGITGSVGKTTTREMVAAALSTRMRTFKTKANLNSQIGVPKTILEIDKEDEIAVMELGISEAGEMSRISNLVRPQVAIVTNIGIAHIENLGTREKIRDEKFHIQDAMPEGGILILNKDDDLLAKSLPYQKIALQTYGGQDSDAYATNVHLVRGCPKFLAHIMGETVEVQLGVYGKHQISNALAALLAAKNFGADLKKAADALSEFRGFAHRQQIFEIDGFVLIDDSYNASPPSMKAAIDILSDIPVDRRVAIFADMRELGDEEVKLHREIGEYLAAKGNIQELRHVGKLSKEIKDAFQKHQPDASTLEFENVQQLKDYTLEHLMPGCAYLLKGANSFRLMDVADAMRKGQ